jgi:hypothetical protein
VALNLIKTIASSIYYIFQQDCLPSHKGKRTWQWLVKNSLIIVLHTCDWCSSSLHNFCLFHYMLSKITNTKYITKDQFKVILIKIGRNCRRTSTFKLKKLFFHPNSYCGPHCKAENSFMIRKYETQNGTRKT